MVGSISNCYPPSSWSKSLLMADMRCLPGMHIYLFYYIVFSSGGFFLTTMILYLLGMEGCPVFDEQGRLIGVLIRPLVHYMTGAEIQV